MSRTVEILDDVEQFADALLSIEKWLEMTKSAIRWGNHDTARRCAKRLAHHGRIALKCKAVIDI